MEIDEKTYEYDSFIRQATGSMSRSEEYRIIPYTFDIYEIKVKVSPNNEFLGIVEVKVNKDFLSHKQRLSKQSYLDVSDYYRE